jgi:hemerythrin-like domain-containing protein
MLYRPCTASFGTGSLKTGDLWQRWAAPLHAEIERLGAKYLSTSSLAGSEVDEFRSAVRDLASMYKQHIAVEDELVFPLAARVLSDAEKSTIAEEMASRRNVRVVTEITELRK